MSIATLAGLTLLVIGESHMALKQNLINPLHDDLTNQGAKVHSIGSCGASAEQWLTMVKADCSGERIGNNPGTFKTHDASGGTIPISQLLETDKPDLVVVIIGDTLGSYDTETYPKAWVYTSVTNLTKEIAASKVTCVWVGPAWGQEGGMYKKTNAGAQRVSNFLAKTVAPCIYVDSLKMSKIGEWKTVKGDGEHFDTAGYKAWADGITKAIMEIPQVQKLKK